MDIDGLRKQIAEEFPWDRPAEENDFEWWNEGMDLLRAGETQKAETKFKQLILSQPKHFDGYEGLSRIYKAIGRKDDAIVLINEAIRLGKDFMKDGGMDSEGLDRLLQHKLSIKGMDDGK